MADETLKLKFKDQIVTFEKGKTLYEVILENNLDVFWANSMQFSCNGKGICAICLLKVLGKTQAMNDIEVKRLKTISLKTNKNIRMACQCVPESDVTVEKPKLI